MSSPKSLRQHFCLSGIMLSFLVLGLLAACSPTRFLEEDEFLLDNVTVHTSKRDIPTESWGADGYNR